MRCDNCGNILNPETELCHRYHPAPPPAPAPDGELTANELIRFSTLNAELVALRARAASDAALLKEIREVLSGHTTCGCSGPQETLDLIEARLRRAGEGGSE